MKIKTIISALFVLIVTILYFFGSCKWDIWVYLLSIACTALYMLIFARQQKKYDKLIELKDDNLESFK